MNHWKWFLSIFLFGASAVLADTAPLPPPPKPEGWSFDIGGVYTWMSFSTPPTYRGNTGGFLGKITYQQPNAFFGQARSVYNLGPLSHSERKARLHESYTEFVAGFCISALENWTITPYAGLGMDFLFDHHRRHSSSPSIQLKYRLYYAVVGLETHYTWTNWMLGLQIDCLPAFNQYLKVSSLSQAAWVLKNRTGAEVQLPVSYRYVKNFWLEFAPYYRFLPIGASHALELHKRNLNQWGAFIVLRFFLN